MTLLECLLILIALSINVFLAAEYEGSNLKSLGLKKILAVSAVFFAGQLVSFSAGYMLANIPFFKAAHSRELEIMCYALSAVIFLLLGLYMFLKAWKDKPREERACDIQIGRIALEACTVALFTFGAGLGCGFLEAPVVSSFVSITCATIIAVVIGLYVGFWQGARFRVFSYSMGCVLFVAIGVEVLIRYI